MRFKLKFVCCLLGLIYFKSFAQAPSWSVDPGSFNYTMTIVGAININYQESVDVNDVVGVFVGGQCRGVASPVFESSVNRYIVFLVIYANTNNEVLNFKVYQNSSNTIFDIPVTKLFTNNGNLGNLVLPYIWSSPTLSNESFILTYSVPNEIAPAVFNANDITFQMPYGTDFTNIVANYTTSDRALVKVSGAVQQSGVSVNDFTTPKQYVVRSADETNTTTYNVSGIIINSPPTDINISNDTINEVMRTGTKIGYFHSTDIDVPNTHIYSLVAGAGSSDNAAFQIIGDSLYSNIIFDYETRNLYSIRVRSNDQNGGVFEKQFTINIKDYYEDINISCDSVNEIMRIGSIIGSFNYSDTINSGFVYSLVTGNGSEGNYAFVINGNILKSAIRFDYETQNAYPIRVKVVNNLGVSFEKQFIIKVVDYFENIQLSCDSINEIWVAGTPIGVFSFSDTINSGHVYSFATGAGDINNAAFSIVGNTLKSAARFDFETQNTYSIRVKVNDNLGATFEKQFTIHITNYVENITLSCDSINEIKIAGSTVGLLYYSDTINSGHVYSFANGTGDIDNAAFTISGNTLKSAIRFNYNIKNRYYIRLKVNDNLGATFEKEFVIKITNYIEDIMLTCDSINEIILAGSTIGYLSYTDTVNSGHTYSLTSGVIDNAAFSIVGNTLKSAIRFDFETQNSYSIRVMVNDNLGATFEKQFTVHINNFIENITLSCDSINEIKIAGSTVGLLSYSDTINSGHVYTFATGAGDNDNAAFTLSGNTLKSAIRFNYEVKNLYYIRLKVNDNLDATFEQAFVIKINNYYEDIQLSNDSINEIMFVGSTIGNFTYTDTINSGHTFSLTSGVGDIDNAAFTISGNTLKSAIRFDYETKNTYYIRVKVNDNLGATNEKAFIVRIINYFENITLSCDSINEIMIAGTTIGNLGYTDTVNTGHTFTLTTGVGDNDNAAFSIVGNTLKSTIRFDFETKNIYYLRVKVNDNHGATFEKPLTIKITNYSEDILLSRDSINEIWIAGTTIGSFNYTDTINTNHIFSLTSGVGDFDNSAFSISGNLLKSAIRFDYEIKSIYYIRVKVNDNHGSTFEKSFIININNYFEDIVLSCDTIGELSNAGALIGNFSYTDTINTGFTYTLVTGVGSSDNASFTITGNSLKSALRFDYETQNLYSIRVRVDDNLGAIYEKPFTIKIIDYPEGLLISQTNIPETLPMGSFVLKFSTSDTTSPVHYYSLIAGTGDDDNPSFEISNDTLKNVIRFDYETKTSYTFRAKVTNGMGWAYEDYFTIQILDRNDEPPIASDANIYIDENVSNQIIYNISATDNDATPAFRNLKFKQDVNQFNSDFKVDSINGALTVLNPLDFENDLDNIVIVNIDDELNITRIKINVMLNDLNDETPQSVDSVNLQFSDSIPLESQLYQFIATDADTNATLFFTSDNDFDGTFVLTQDGLLILKKYFNFDKKNQYKFKVTVSDGLHKKNIIVTIDILYTDRTAVFKANKIISPNGDDYLDYWYIEGRGSYRDCIFQIYNSSGEKIFDQLGYDTFWDGTYNGKELPIGAYYYVVKTPRGEYIRGSITLIK